MKQPRSVLDNLKPSPAALKQLEQLQAALEQREAKGVVADPIDFVFVTPVPNPDWPPAPLVPT